jgi:hypothetical protein
MFFNYKKGYTLAIQQQVPSILAFAGKFALE